MCLYHTLDLDNLLKYSSVCTEQLQGLTGQLPTSPSRSVPHLRRIMTVTQSQVVPQVQFVIPEASSFDDFAEIACLMLAEQVDSDFASHEVIDGFSQILRITAEFGAQLLTQAFNEELRDLFDPAHGLYSEDSGLKTVFRAVRWHVPNTKRIMVFPQPSRNVLRMRGGERVEYDLTA